jgi:hypothetical protein
LALAVAAVAAAVGLQVARTLSPERLRATCERELGRLTGHPVSIEDVRVELGAGIQVRGRGVELWPQPDGPALRLERVGMGLQPWALLLGRVRARRLIVEGGELRMVRERDGGFRAPFRFLDNRPSSSPHPEEALRPLVLLENTFRFLLDRPRLADQVIVRDSRIQLERVGSGRLLSLALRDGELSHHRLRGEATLAVEGRLSDAEGPLVDLRWSGLRDRSGGLRVTSSFSGLDLASLQQRLPGLGPGAGLSGRAQGALALQSPEAGSGSLELEIAVDDVEVVPPPASGWEPVRTGHLEAGAVLDLQPDSIELKQARLTGGALHLEAGGVLERPLHEASAASLELTFRDIDIADLRALLDWLPDARAEDFASFVAPVTGGLMRTFTARGRATVADWRAFLAGQRPVVAMGIGAEAEFEDVLLEVGESDRIEGLGGRISWSPDRVEIREARATLNGEPLPELDLTFEGVSHLLEVDPQRRQLTAGAPPLPGVGPLWRALSGNEDAERTRPDPVEMDLDVEWLHHPVFLWPLEGLRIRMRAEPQGLHLELADGRWAGVPIRGDGDWRFEPRQVASLRLRAETPEPGMATQPEGRDWARGSLSLGPLRGPRWQQAGARGRFRATGRWIRLEPVQIDLEPGGRALASVALDLSEPERVPYQLSFEMADANVAAVLHQLFAGDEIVTGSLDAWGSFEGSLRPGTSSLADLTGLLELSARDGHIRRSLPPVVAIALASNSFNPFAEREIIRYRSATTLLRFADDRISTDELSIDGPDMRLIASGDVALLEETHPVDAQVALFLFRQIDRAVGTIPLMNVLLLGTNDSLLGAYFELDGPWARPESRLVPLRSLSSAGPASAVLEGVPSLLRRGLRALGWTPQGRAEAKPAAPAPQEPWVDTPVGS